jgi:hypothetical protein
LQFESFSKPNLDGEITASVNATGDWIFVSPNSTGETILNFVCKK